MITYIYWLLIISGVLLAVLRIILGPKLEDRIASLDGINVIITGAIVLLASTFNNSLYLDVALIYAVLAFLETVVISRIIEKNKELK
ncbi:MAG: cation:proton antiporter [Candidatus Mcinerneyibacterium aminivorans]|uniref:Cation:proton antiporter n=1 Tax=Candidatus Mcinerneyibacterium aminivorans TaxID=2703815 RepID=A0A5D0MEJ4_9BACT|nr:MAG: cation:proton antiporter [Candidatus Mcinerneyibacterium aminivorans]